MQKQLSAPTLIDLFCGCGGMSLGAARAGFRVAAGVDKDSRALRAHAKNFPKSRHLNRDISQRKGTELLAQSGVAVGTLDVLTGGPPCQGFSTMGNATLTTAETP